MHMAALWVSGRINNNFIIFKLWYILRSKQAHKSYIPSTCMEVMTICTSEWKIGKIKMTLSRKIHPQEVDVHFQCHKISPEWTTTCTLVHTYRQKGHTTQNLCLSEHTRRHPIYIWVELWIVELYSQAVRPLVETNVYSLRFPGDVVVESFLVGKCMHRLVNPNNFFTSFRKYCPVM